MNSKHPLISVIIPTYNSSTYISKSLQELDKQKYDNYEVIIVNDGSHDNTLVILNEVAANNSRLKVINKDNGGVSSARNMGLLHARGEFITFLDDDDRIDPEFLFKMYARLNETRSNAVYCGMYRAYDDALKEDVKVVSSFDSGLILYKFLTGEICFHLGCLLIRRNFIEEHSLYFDEHLRIGEDLLYIYNLLSICPVQYIAEYMYYYVCRPGSVMNAKRDSAHYQHEAYAHEIIRDVISQKYFYTDRDDVHSFLLVNSIRHKIRYMWKLLLLGDLNLLTEEISKNRELFDNAKCHNFFDRKTKVKIKLLKAENIFLWKIIRLINKR